MRARDRGSAPLTAASPICSSGRYVSGAGEWTPWPSVFACSREMYRLPLLRLVSEYDGASPLELAAAHGQADVVRWLLEELVAMSAAQRSAAAGGTLAIAAANSSRPTAPLLSASTSLKLRFSPSEEEAPPDPVAAPPPPRATGTKATKLTLHSFHFRGARLRQEVTEDAVTFELLEAESVVSLQARPGGKPQPPHKARQGGA